MPACILSGHPTSFGKPILEDSFSSPSRRRARPPRRPERQQILLRRGLAVGGGLIVLILLVLAVRGCLDARKSRALSDYASDVTQIVVETEQTSKTFFGKLSDPGELSVTDFVDQVNADRSAMDSYEARVDGLDAPGDMSDAQTALELTYDLRSSAMNEVAEQMSTALGEVGAEKAIETIASQMRKLMGSDVLYTSVVKPGINSVLAENGIEGEDVPDSVFVPEGTTWLDESAVGAALGAVSGQVPEGETPGIHGLGLISTSIGGTELVPEATTEVSADEAPEVEVQVQNQGESTENDVSVSVTVDGNTLEGGISSIAAGEISTATILLTPAPKGTVTLEVKVQPVPGEQVSENNEASYTVEFK
ncbi:MAG: CARDB domain-containing protein [Solirubrobacterales bacterium]